MQLGLKSQKIFNKSILRNCELLMNYLNAHNINPKSHKHEFDNQDKGYSCKFQFSVIPLNINK